MVAPKRKTAAYIIFNYIYQVYIPQHHLYSAEYIKLVGIPTTGNPSIDRELANSKTLSQQTIVGMSEMLDNGASMTLADPAKSAEIYTAIREHLTEFDARVRQGQISGDDIPHDDLRKLDNLAAELFTQAKYYMKADATDSRLFNSIASLSSRPGLRRNATPTEKKPIKQTDYQPISDSISKNAFATSKWRR